MCFLLFQTPLPNPKPPSMCPSEHAVHAPLLPGGPPDFSTLRCDSLCLLFWIDLARVLLLEVCQRTDWSHAGACNPVSHADAVWIFLQSCLFPCCNLVTHPWWSILGKLRADTGQRMHLIRKINKRRRQQQQEAVRSIFTRSFAIFDKAD